jgi:hypothetical protein
MASSARVHGDMAIGPARVTMGPARPPRVTSKRASDIARNWSNQRYVSDWAPKAEPPTYGVPEEIETVQTGLGVVRRTSIYEYGRDRAGGACVC